LKINLNDCGSEKCPPVDGKISFCGFLSGVDAQKKVIFLK
jgi:hypothetical protein